MPVTPSRRQLLQTAVAGAPALLAAAPAMAATKTEPVALRPNSIPVADLPRHLDVEPGYNNLENGY